MTVPLPDPIIRTRFLVKPDANVVLADRDGLARIGFEGFGVAGEDDPDDLPLELGLFFGELGFVLVVVGGGEVGGVEEQVFEGLGEEGGVGGGWGSDLEATHEGLEHEVVEVGGAGEGAHDIGFLDFRSRGFRLWRTSPRSIKGFWWVKGLWNLCSFGFLEYCDLEFLV